MGLARLTFLFLTSLPFSGLTSSEASVKSILYNESFLECQAAQTVVSDHSKITIYVKNNLRLNFQYKKLVSFVYQIYKISAAEEGDDTKEEEIHKGHPPKIP